MGNDGKDEGTIDILGNIVADGFGEEALDDNTVERGGGFACIDDGGGAVINRDVVGIEFVEDCNKPRFVMAADESGGAC